MFINIYISFFQIGFPAQRRSLPLNGLFHPKSPSERISSSRTSGSYRWWIGKAAWLEAITWICRFHRWFHQETNTPYLLLSNLQSIGCWFHERNQNARRRGSSYRAAISLVPLGSHSAGSLWWRCARHSLSSDGKPDFVRYAAFLISSM